MLLIVIKMLLITDPHVVKLVRPLFILRTQIKIFFDEMWKISDPACTLKNALTEKYWTEHMLGCFQPTVGLNV